MSFASTNSAMRKLQPELAVGGYSAYDGTVEFYGRVKALLQPQMRVVDLGAGRGAWFEDDESDYRKRMRLLRGSVLEVIGCDVDRAVLANRAVDRAEVLQPGAPLPFADGSVDMVISDYVFEHVTEPLQLASELARILKPGGWVCARTPTRYNYVSVAARLVANLHHARLLRLVQPGRKAEDVFPTVYLLNTRRSVRRAFSESQFADHTYLYANEPQYFFGKKFIYRSFQLFHWLLPTALHGNLFIFLRRR